MEDLLIELLSSFGFPVHLQGTLGPDESYPAHFFTWWERPSYDGSHYDDKAVSCVYDYDINFYSIDPTYPYKYIREAKKLLKENGFIISGNGGAVASDEITHTGRAIEALYLEREV